MAQTVSYEVSFGLILLPIIVVIGGWSFQLLVDLGEI